MVVPSNPVVPGVVATPTNTNPFAADVVTVTPTVAPTTLVTPTTSVTLDKLASVPTAPPQRVKTIHFQI